MLRKAEKRLTNNKLMLIILGLTFLFRIPSFFEPYWYGDEAIYLTIGQAMRNGVKLYSQIHDNKPPFLYVMAAVANGDQFWFKFIATVWILITIYIFYKLAQKLFEKREWVIAATVIFAFLTTWTKLEGNIANAELFFLLPTTLTVYLLWDKNPTLKRVFYSGAILGMGVMFKMPVIIEAGIWPVVWLITGEREWFKKSWFLALGVIAPIGISVLYFWEQGALKEYLNAAWLQNLPYLTSWKTTTAAGGIYSLKARLAIVCMLIAPLAGLGRTIGKRGLVVGLWGILTIFATLLSGRPYPHYLLQAAAAVAFLPILIFTGRTSEKIVAGIVIGVATASIWAFHFYNYPTISYYLNFVKWVTGSEDRKTYFDWFNPQLNNYYQIAGIIDTDTKPGDKIFIWGDVPMLYALSRRLPVGKYTVEYHIKDFKAQGETVNALTIDPPKYIVTFGNEADLPGLSMLLGDSYIRQTNLPGIGVFRLSILDQPKF
jgi:4-amino-4-deoxy-L-arabinose transferase-like glycosyltransferase